MFNEAQNGIRNPAEDGRDKSLFRVGQRVAVNLGGCPENRTEGVITAINELPTLTTYQLRFDGYGSHAGVDTGYMAERSPRWTEAPSSVAAGIGIEWSPRERK